MKRNFCLLGIVLCLVSCIQKKSQEVIDLSEAAITAEKFIEDQMGDCDFGFMNYTGEEIQTIEGRFKVLHKFTKNGITFYSKIYLQYKGGDWTDKNNWSYGNLTIENPITGKQFYFQGKMKDEEVKKSGTLMINNINLNIARADALNSIYIHLYTDKILSKEELKPIIRELNEQYGIINFLVYPQIENGKEYISYTYGKIYDFVNDEVFPFEEW